MMQIVIYLSLFLLVIVSWLPRSHGPIDLRWDGGVYYILGTSLAEGKGYRLLNEPGEIEAVQYPPLLPLIVAAHQWALGTSDPIIVGQWLRFSFFMIFAVYIFAVYLMLRNYLPLTYAFLGTLVCLFNLHTYFMSDLLFPEIPFALVTVLFFLCNQNKSGRIYPILAAVFAMAAYALRTIGITLLVAWIAESLLNREFKKAAVRLTFSLIPILCWQSYISFVESRPQYNHPVYEYQRADYLFYNVSYTKNIFRLKDSFSPELGHAAFADLAERFANNLARLPVHIGEGVSAKVTAKTMLWEATWREFTKTLSLFLLALWLAYLVVILYGSLVLSGIALQLIERQWIMPLYILFSLAAMCLTPWPQQFNRYMTPLSPFLALFLFTMLLALKDCKTVTQRCRVMCGIFTSSIVFSILIQQSLTLFLVYTRWHQTAVSEDQSGKKNLYSLFFYHDSYRVLDAGLDWVKRRAEPTDVVAVSMPHWVYLRTGLKTVMPPFEPDPVEAQRLLDSVPVDYLVLDEGLAVDTRKYTAPVVQNFPARWKRVYSSSVVMESGEELKDRFEIYQRVDLGTSSAEPDSTPYLTPQ